MCALKSRRVRLFFAPTRPATQRWNNLFAVKSDFTFGRYNRRYNKRYDAPTPPTNMGG